MKLKAENENEAKGRRRNINEIAIRSNKNRKIQQLLTFEHTMTQLFTKHHTKLWRIFVSPQNKRQKIIDHDFMAEYFFISSKLF